MQTELAFQAPRKQRSYYDTTHLSPLKLTAAIATAETQDAAVLAVFRTVRQAAPSKVLEIIEEHRGRILITSVRRSIASLTRDGLLVKTDTLVEGPWNALEHVWRVA